MTTFMEFQRLIRVQIKPKDDIMAKIAEINMLFNTITGQGITLDDKMKALLLVHSMAASWDQAPTNILSSIDPTKLDPDTVIPRMKEVWSHKSGQTMLPRQMEPLGSSSQVKKESNSLLSRMNKPPLCNICKGGHNTQDHRGGGNFRGRGGCGNRGRGRGGGYQPYPQQNNQQQSGSSNRGKNQNRRRGKGKAKAQANELNVPGQGAEDFNLASIEELNDDYPVEQDFDITAIEYNRPQSPEYSPAPAAIETVMSSDMNITLGQHNISLNQDVTDPELTAGDIDMAMEHVGYVPSLPVQPDGHLSEWYIDRIAEDFAREVESVTPRVNIPRSNSPCHCTICLRAAATEPTGFRMGLSLRESQQWETTDPLSRTIPFPSSDQGTGSHPGNSLKPSDGMGNSTLAGTIVARERDVERSSEIP
ncbi:hypothetical protein M404DRAFT_10699 [Pisolithus tinctorius Marx 270]|uniref:Uncharacterized protein n=1 Tax=Pisolithus tinctorius Marx 270 TaxID=870435 RepID=A0A0C3NQJ2_PISTI|nr:hypothetical protein M404DRAFT_10699 [Pisolithus tinctorius Marx 270]